MRVRIEVGGRVVASRVQWARTFKERSRGLRGRARLRDGEALVLSPARQLHTFGLSYPIDVVFLDRGGRVVHVVHGMGPKRFTRPVVRAECAIELPAGGASAVRPGEKVAFYEDRER